MQHQDIANYYSVLQNFDKENIDEINNFLVMYQNFPYQIRSYIFILANS